MSSKETRRPSIDINEIYIFPETNQPTPLISTLKKNSVLTWHVIPESEVTRLDQTATLPIVKYDNTRNEDAVQNMHSVFNYMYILRINPQI